MYLVTRYDVDLSQLASHSSAANKYPLQLMSNKNEGIFEMKREITYTENNGIYYPDLELPKQTNYPLGKYANMRLEFMKKHRRGTYTTLLTEGILNEYLHEIDIQAYDMLDSIISHFSKERGVNEDLKSRDPLQWAAEMNNIKVCAEDMILREIIYTK